MEKYCYKVAGIVAEIDYSAIEYGDYLEKEFGLLKCSFEKADIKVTVHNEGYKMPYSGKECFQKVQNGVAQFFKAFGRHFVIVYKSISEMDIYIPYSLKDSFARFVNPYYEPRALCCLEDFFHNPFLLILQMNLLKKNASLFHCSAFLDEEGKCFALAGEGHTGKTAMLKEFVKREKVRAIAEDFSAVDSSGMVYGYPHQMGVKTKNLDSKEFRGLGDKVNRKVYETLTGKRNVRHFPFKKIISDKFAESAGITAVLFLDRKEVFEVKKADSFRAVQLATDIITREFENMVSVKELSKKLFEEGLSDAGFDELIKRTGVVYGSFFERVSKIYDLKLPLYEEKSVAAKKISEVCGEV